jgi:hypothetical protein
MTGELLRGFFAAADRLFASDGAGGFFSEVLQRPFATR